MKRAFTVIAAFAALLIFQNCSSSKKTAAPTVAALSYEKDIAGMIKTSCAPCHFPPDGKKEALDSYESISKHIDEVIKRVKLPQSDMGFMPFKMKKPALSDSAINVLEQWKQQGMGK